MTLPSLTLFAAALLAASPVPAAAQVAAPTTCDYAACAVRLHVGFTGERLVRGETSGEVLKLSFTGRNAADFLGRVEKAAAPARDFRTRRVRASILAIISGLAAGYVFATVYDDDDNDDLGFEADPTADTYVALFASLGTGIWAGIETTRSRNSLSRAIWEFNRAPIP